MNWVLETFTSSIGKKTLMAVTGLSFCAFLALHLFGNFFLYVGRESFNSYVVHLHTLGVLVNLAEAGLIAFALIHVITAVTLYFQNLFSRPARYAVKKSAGGRTWASRLMPYTGLYILIFVLIHLVNIKFAETPNRTVYDLVDALFTNPGYLAYYVFSMIVVAFHVSHGLWSGFQTLGLNHPQYMPAIQKLSLALAVIVGVGFGFIPIMMFAG
ncbi:MAG: succinate dehydrogenase cytochrome b subunit [Thermodesulfobacteriota bacterium]